MGPSPYLDSLQVEQWGPVPITAELSGPTGTLQPGGHEGGLRRCPRYARLDKTSKAQAGQNEAPLNPKGGLARPQGPGRGLPRLLKGREGQEGATSGNGIASAVQTGCADHAGCILGFRSPPRHGADARATQLRGQCHLRHPSHCLPGA